MARHFTLFLCVLAFFAVGCSSPTQRVRSRDPHWQSNGQYMAAEKNSYTGGLVWQPFPDLNNPLHLEIWKSVQKNGYVGDGYGAICNYYGTYLVTISVTSAGVYTPVSYFYFPQYHSLIYGRDQAAFDWYKGDRKATQTNAVLLVKHLLAVNEYKSFVIYCPDDIPHTAFQKDNPKLPFAEFLASESIIITPPTLMRVNGYNCQGGDGAYNVFAYMPVGGQIYRYEVRCSLGNIEAVRKFLIGEEIGDCLYLY
jgi:hypothetical protein